MSKLFLIFLLFLSTHAFTADQPKLKVKSIEKLGNFTARFNFILENTENIKCIHLKKPHKELQKHCNSNENFTFPIVRQYRHRDTFNNNLIFFEDIILEDRNGNLQSLGRYARGHQPWIKMHEMKKVDTIHHSSTVLLEKHDLDQRLVPYDKVVKATMEKYELNFNISAQDLENISCVYIPKKENISNQDYLNIPWPKDTTHQEFCNDNVDELANNINETKFIKEIIMMPKYTVKHMGCFGSDCLFTKINLTGDYSPKNGWKSITVIMLTKSNDRIDVRIPIKN